MLPTADASASDEADEALETVETVETAGAGQQRRALSGVALTVPPMSRLSVGRQHPATQIQEVTYTLQLRVADARAAATRETLTIQLHSGELSSNILRVGRGFTRGESLSVELRYRVALGQLDRVTLGLSGA